MRFCRSWYLVCFAVLMTVCACGQRSESWLPITQQDLQIKDVPGDPGAPAIQLYYADFRDDVRESEFVYHRIKVLNEGGKDYANVEIEIPPHYSLSDLQARTVHPDKSIVEFTGKPFEKLVMKYRGEKLVAKTFTLPAVTTGSIVEYKYRLGWDRYFFDPTWVVQHELYTAKESFWLRRFTGTMPTEHISDETQLSYVSSNMPPGAAPKDTGVGVELELENVPAFKSEKYMPPEANFKAQVQFFYGGREIESPEAFWREKGLDWYGKSEHFTANGSELKAAAALIIGSETDPEKKLRKLYTRAQQTRNLSYEPGPETGLKANENAKDVFVRGYGTRNEIAELFSALAEAAGFRPELLRVSSRRDRVFDPKLLSENQLDDEIVRVSVNGADLFLDPGTKFCPFGLVAWTYTSVPALQLDKNGGKFVVVPTATADKNVTHRNAELELKPDGTTQIHITVEFKGNDALERRLDALGSDEAGRKQSLEEELRFWLPSGAVVRLENVEGWDSSEEPLVAYFVAQLPGFFAVAGNRLAIPANLFHSNEMEAFAGSERRYPVYFPYTYEQIDKITLHVPQGYGLEALPKGQDIKLASTRFITTRLLQKDEVLLTRALVVNSIYFQPDQYGQLKNFFQRLKAADEEQIVLTAKNQ